MRAGLQGGKKKWRSTFLVEQWIGICLPTQGTQAWSLVQEDSTWCGAAKPVSHGHRVCLLQLPKPWRLEAVLCNKGSPCNEKPTHHNKEQPHSSQPERKPAQSNKDRVSQKSASITTRPEGQGEEAVTGPRSEGRPSWQRAIPLEGLPPEEPSC